VIAVWATPQSSKAPLVAGKLRQKSGFPATISKSIEKSRSGERFSPFSHCFHCSQLVSITELMF
jgi:hypothetical protein